MKRLGLGPDVVIAKDLVESGNTSAASIPLALSKLVERREVPGPPRSCSSASAAASPTPARSFAVPDTFTRPESTTPPLRGITGKMATRAEITSGLAEILEEVAGVNPDDVAEEKSFTDDLDVDSLSMVEVVVAAEEKFGVKIPDNEVQNLKTVGDAVSYIEANH